MKSKKGIIIISTRTKFSLFGLTKYLAHFTLAQKGILYNHFFSGREYDIFTNHGTVKN